MPKHTLRGMTRIGMMSALVACCSLAHGQQIRWPRTLYECDVLPARKDCATWNWTGLAYEGKWPESGAAGQITVQSSNGSSFVMKRIDPSGAMHGMVATYTGKWDGEQVVEGRESWSWNGHTAVNGWTASLHEPESAPAPDASPAPTTGIPVVLYKNQFGGNNVRYGVSNRYTASLTAYAVHGVRPDGNSWTHVEDLRIQQQEPLKSGQNRDDGYIYTTFTLPRGLAVIGAVFADGLGAGDPVTVAAIMDKRKEELFTYGTMSRKLCSLVQERQGTAAIIHKFEAAKGEYVHANSDKKYVNGGGEQAYSVVMGSLNAEVNSSAPEAARKTLQSIQEHSRGLSSDPVKDSSGKFFLTGAPAAFSCRLP